MRAVQEGHFLVCIISGESGPTALKWANMEETSSVGLLESLMGWTLLQAKRQGMQGRVYTDTIILETKSRLQNKDCLEQRSCGRNPQNTTTRQREDAERIPWLFFLFHPPHFQDLPLVKPNHNAAQSRACGEFITVRSRASQRMVESNGREGVRQSRGGLLLPFVNHGSIQESALTLFG